MPPECEGAGNVGLHHRGVHPGHALAAGELLAAGDQVHPSPPCTRHLAPAPLHCPHLTARTASLSTAACPRPPAWRGRPPAGWAGSRSRARRAAARGTCGGRRSAAPPARSSGTAAACPAAGLSWPAWCSYLDIYIYSVLTELLLTSGLISSRSRPAPDSDKSFVARTGSFVSLHSITNLGSDMVLFLKIDNRYPAPHLVLLSMLSQMAPTQCW